MNITLEKITDVTGKLILKVEEADYAANMEKSLKNMKKWITVKLSTQETLLKVFTKKMYL